MHYSWGLGQMSNHKAEANGLLLGLRIIREEKINNEIIFGDSSLIIHAMVSGTLPKNVALSQVLYRAKNLVKKIGVVDFYHILRENNKNADSQANEGA